jgi:hypothetical protein
MREYLNKAKRLLLTAPALAGSALAGSPTQAATFAAAQADAVFFNFSEAPVLIGADAETETFAMAQNGLATAIAEAQAQFVVEPPAAFNATFSEALGEGRDYLATARSEASVIGVFDVEDNFSFDFVATLALQTSIDNPSAESARAAGDISFALLDFNNGTLLEFFSLVGDINTPGHGDFIASQISENVTIEVLDRIANFGGNEEFAISSVVGSLQRNFPEPIALALIEVKTTQTRVQAPEPSGILALVFSGGMIGVLCRAKKKSSSAA